jgi:hypothetical protein
MRKEKKAPEATSAFSSGVYSKGIRIGNTHSV